MKRLLKGGRVVDPANGRDGLFDILLDGDRIARVGKDLLIDGALVIDVPAGFVVTPGLFDMHVHLREPGQEHKETVATGTASAVADGELRSAEHAASASAAIAAAPAWTNRAIENLLEDTTSQPPSVGVAGTTRRSRHRDRRAKKNALRPGGWAAGSILYGLCPGRPAAAVRRAPVRQARDVCLQAPDNSRKGGAAKRELRLRRSSIGDGMGGCLSPPNASRAERER